MNAVVEHKPEKSAYERLPRRYRRAVDHYVLEGKTGAESVRLAGCKSSHPNNVAYKLFRRPEVQAAIEERERQVVADMGVRHRRIIEELYWVATCDPRKLVDGEGVQIPLHELPADIAACISAVEVENISINGETGTRYKYKFWDKNKALDKLGQYLKLWDTKGPTVNVDARSVTNNTVHVGGAEAISGAVRLLEQARAIGVSASAALGHTDGSLLPSAVCDESPGHRTSVDVGEDSGGTGAA